MAEALDLSKEKAATRDAYGESTFWRKAAWSRGGWWSARARDRDRLGGWDTHQDNFKAVEKLSSTLDAGWSALLADLEKRDLLDTTLIVWMGEFGRNAADQRRSGRDHYPMAFTAVLAGGGIKAGR